MGGAALADRLFGRSAAWARARPAPGSRHDPDQLPEQRCRHTTRIAVHSSTAATFEATSSDSAAQIDRQAEQRLERRAPPSSALPQADGGGRHQREEQQRARRARAAAVELPARREQHEVGDRDQRRQRPAASRERERALARARAGAAGARDSPRCGPRRPRACPAGALAARPRGRLRLAGPTRHLRAASRSAAGRPPRAPRRSVIARTTTIRRARRARPPRQRWRHPARRSRTTACARARPRRRRSRDPPPAAPAWSASRAPARPRGSRPPGRRRPRRPAPGACVERPTIRSGPITPRASAGASSSWPRCTPSALAASTRSGRSLRMNSAPTRRPACGTCAAAASSLRRPRRPCRAAGSGRRRRAGRRAGTARARGRPAPCRRPGTGGRRRGARGASWAPVWHAHRGYNVASNGSPPG